jgi:hypothetical protein
MELPKVTILTEGEWSKVRLWLENFADDTKEKAEGAMRHEAETFYKEQEEAIREFLAGKK